MSSQEKLLGTNKLICDDNLEELAKLPKESVDMIYIDPPFFTHKQYEVVWGNGAEKEARKGASRAQKKYFAKYANLGA